MRKKNYKGRCQKKSLSKCNNICRTYDDIQFVYADKLESDNNIKDIKCNVVLDEKLNDNEYMSDFVCTNIKGDIIIRECVFRKHLMKPLTIKLLDFSRNYWLKHGVSDWGIVINEEK